MKTALIAAGLLLAASSQAEVVRYVQSTAGRIDLHRETGMCLSDALRAEYGAADGAVVPGCWRTDGVLVVVVFLDGDIARIPFEALQKPTPA